MANLSRTIDPITRDYIADTSTGGTETTRNALGAVYHQAKTKLAQWWGDPEAGSRFSDLDRAKSIMRTPIVVQDIWIELLTPLVDAGLITEPEFESERIIDRVNTKVVVIDLASGLELDLTDLLPFEP